MLYGPDPFWNVSLPDEDFAFEGARIGAPHVERVQRGVRPKHVRIASGEGYVAGPKGDEASGVGEDVRKS